MAISVVSSKIRLVRRRRIQSSGGTYMTKLLEISDLSVAFGNTTVARNIGFAIDAGETVALVGDGP